mgnify:FL=1
MKKCTRNNILKWYIIILLTEVLFVGTSLRLKNNKTLYFSLIIVNVILMIEIVVILSYEVLQRKKFSNLLKNISVDKEFSYDSQKMCFDFNKNVVAILYYKNKYFYPNFHIVPFENIIDKKMEVKNDKKRNHLILSINVVDDKQNEEKIEVCDLILKDKELLLEENLKSNNNSDIKKIIELSELLDVINKH